MRKGFIELVALIGVVSVLIVGTVVFSQRTRNQEVEKLKQKLEEVESRPTMFNSGKRLGAVVTPVFPTSTNNFSEGDIIEEENWNQLEIWMGTRNSTNTLSINYRLASSSSINPGHVHGISGGGASVSGTLPIENGGTETTSLTLNNVILGNGTSAVTFVAPGGNGNVLTSDGTAWISQSQQGNTFTAVAGEDVNTGQALMISSGLPLTQLMASSTSDNNCTYANDVDTLNGTACGMTFVVTSTRTIGAIAFQLFKAGSPVGTSTFYLASTTSGLPTTILASTTQINDSTLTTAARWYTLHLNRPFIVTGGTTYAVFASSTSVNSGTNNVETVGNNTNVPNQQCVVNNVSTWVACGGAPALEALNFQVLINSTSGLAYLAGALTTSTSNGFVGFANATTSQGSTVTVDAGGVETRLNSLTAGLQHYLSNGFGSLSSSTGNTTRKVGISLSTSSLLITNIW